MEQDARSAPHESKPKRIVVVTIDAVRFAHDRRSTRAKLAAMRFPASHCRCRGNVSPCEGSKTSLIVAALIVPVSTGNHVSNTLSASIELIQGVRAHPTRPDDRRR